MEDVTMLSTITPVHVWVDLREDIAKSVRTFC